MAIDGSFATGSLWGQAAGVVVGAIGAASTQRHTNRALRSQANIARLNAQMMMDDYYATLRAGEKEVQKVTMAAGRTKSAQKAALAANGIQLGVGSAAEQVATTDLLKELEVNQISSNYLSQAWGYRRQAVNFEGQALSAEAGMMSSGSAAAHTLLSGASQVAGNYLLYKELGAFGDGQKSRSNKK